MMVLGMARDGTGMRKVGRRRKLNNLLDPYTHPTAL
jgi:hypothetical protein